MPWLVLIHQLPPKPAYFRVKVWRRLQALGALAIKSSVYVLPNTDEAREDFAWMLREIRKGGGDASVAEAGFVEGLSDEAVRTSFQSAREADYRAVAAEARGVARGFPRRGGRAPSPARRAAVEAGIGRLQKRLAEIAKIDFFGAPGREAADWLVRDMENRLGAKDDAPPRRGARRLQAAEYRGRTWVTRRNVHVDRMASAWLIQRFIDPEATFAFVQSRGYQPADGELRFDMFEAEFTHDGDLCTYEVLCREFGLSDPAVRRIGEIVHDIDLKDARYGHPETPGLDHLVIGIAGERIDDAARIERAGAVFDGLHGYFRRKRDA